jgi:arylsulfatase A-like enzyme
MSCCECSCWAYPVFRDVRQPRYLQRWLDRCTTPPLAPWEVGKTIDVDGYKWELYNVDQDFSEANDLAAKNPKRLGELQDVFWIEAAKYNVLPLARFLKA